MGGSDSELTARQHPQTVWSTLEIRMRRRGFWEAVNSLQEVTIALIETDDFDQVIQDLEMIYLRFNAMASKYPGKLSLDEYYERIKFDWPQPSRYEQMKGGFLNWLDGWV